MYRPVQAHGPLYGDNVDDVRSFHQSKRYDSKLMNKELSKNTHAIDWQNQMILSRHQQSLPPQYLVNRHRVHHHGVHDYIDATCNEKLHRIYSGDSSIRFMGRESYVAQRKPHYTNIRDR